MHDKSLTKPKTYIAPHTHTHRHNESWCSGCAATIRRNATTTTTTTHLEARIKATTTTMYLEMCVERKHWFCRRVELLISIQLNDVKPPRRRCRRINESATTSIIFFQNGLMCNATQQTRTRSAPNRPSDIMRDFVFFSPSVSVIMFLLYVTSNFKNELVQ